MKVSTNEQCITTKPLCPTDKLGPRLESCQSRRGSESLQIMNSNKINDDKRILLNDLINVSREITCKYNGGKQVVTEEQAEVEKLLSLLEKTLCFGLKNHSLLGNVQELFTSSSSNGSAFWSFAHNHLTKHEQERFSKFKNVN